MAVSTWIYTSRHHGAGAFHQLDAQRDPWSHGHVDEEHSKNEDPDGEDDGAMNPEAAHNPTSGGR